jgi:hypothetical protein
MAINTPVRKRFTITPMVCPNCSTSISEVVSQWNNAEPIKPGGLVEHGACKAVLIVLPQNRLRLATPAERAAATTPAASSSMVYRVYHTTTRPYRYFADAARSGRLLWAFLNSLHVNGRAPVEEPPWDLRCNPLAPTHQRLALALTFPNAYVRVHDLSQIAGALDQTEADIAASKLKFLPEGTAEREWWESKAGWQAVSHWGLIAAALRDLAAARDSRLIGAGLSCTAQTWNLHRGADVMSLVRAE